MVDGSKADKANKKIGVAYEVGVTPDDFNMDYDTSRLLSLKDKKLSLIHI